MLNQYLDCVSYNSGSNHACNFKLALCFMLVSFLPELYSTQSNYYYLIVIIPGGICVLIYTNKICGQTKGTGNPKRSTSTSAIIRQKHLYKATCTLKFTNGSKVVYNVNKGGKQRGMDIFPNSKLLNNPSENHLLPLSASFVGFRLS